MRPIYQLALVAFILTITGLITINPMLLVMTLPFVIYLLSGLITPSNKINLVLERSLSTERTFPGSSVDITTSIINRGKYLGEVIVEDILPPGLKVEKGSPRHLLNLKAGEQFTWKYSISGKRGFYSFSPIWVETRDRLGVHHIRKDYLTSSQLLILPQVIKLKGISIRPRKTRVYSGEIPARSGGLGVEFFGIRQFQTGDPPNRINWRASSRYNSKFFSNEFEQERVSDVGIILDGREIANIFSEGVSLYEHSVLAAASLVNAFLNQGDRVSLLHYGKFLQWTFPGYGKFQRERILRALTQVEPGHSLVFSYLQYLPTQIFPAHSQIVLISSLMKEDVDVLLQVRARRYQVLVISPDPVPFEKRGLPDTTETLLAALILSLERENMLQKLIRGGIRVVNWDVAQPFDNVAGNLIRSPILIRSMS